MKAGGCYDDVLSLSDFLTLFSALKEMFEPQKDRASQ